LFLAASGSIENTMAGRLLDIIFSLGFLKLLCDGFRFLWNRVYNKRVTVDLYVAYVPAGPGLEKRAFLVLRNDTDRDIRVNTVIYENSFWHRRIRYRKAPRIIPPEPLVDVPAYKAIQKAIAYEPNNFIDPHGRYFGVQLAGGKIIWVRARQMRRVLAEYRKDFPEWQTHHVRMMPLKCKDYGTKTGQAGSDGT
jgi:hypothetical protein